MRTLVAAGALAVTIAFAPPIHASSTEGEIRDLFHRGQLGMALQQAQDLVEVRRAEHGRASIETARAVELVKDLVISQDQTPDSLGAWLDEAQATRERIYGASHPETLPSLWRRIALQRALQNLPAMATLIEAAVHIAEGPIETPGAYRVEVLSAQGDLAYDQRDPASALALYREALTLAETLEHPPGETVALMLHKLSRAERRVGRPEESLESVERALGLYESIFPPASTLIAGAANSRAILLRLLGRYAEAIAENERATRIYQAALGEEHPFVAGMLNNLGNLLHTVGDYRRAAAALEESLRIRTERLGPEHPSLAQSYLNLGRVLLHQHRPQEAVDAYEHALAIQRRRGAMSDPVTVKVLSSLGSAYNQSERFEDARAVLEEVIEVVESQLGPDRLELALPLANLSVTERFLGNPQRSLELAERGMDIQVLNYGSSESPHIEGYEARAIALFQVGRVEEAIQTALRAELMSRLNLQLTAGGISESTAHLAARSRDSKIPISLRFAAALPTHNPDLIERVVEEAFRSRALVLDQAMTRHRRMLHRDDDRSQAALQKLDEKRSELLAHVSRSPMRGELKEYTRRYDELRDEIVSAETAFAQTDPLGANQRDIRLEDVRKALPPRAALVSYWYAAPLRSVEDPDGVYFAMVTTRESVDLVELPDANQIDENLLLWRDAIETMPTHDDARADQVAFERGQRLREQVWDPLRPALEGYDLILIVPDVDLHFLPFAALPNADGSFLVENGPTIHMLSSERDLILDDLPVPEREEGLLVLGGANFNAAEGAEAFSPRVLPAHLRSISDCVSFRSMQFEPLPASQIEAESIARLWTENNRSDPLVLSGSAAREEAVRDQVARYSNLHFATHGFFLGGECEEPAPRMRGVGGMVPSWSHSDAVEETFRLSGLALAGANQRQARGFGARDGILTAEEIASLDLRGVRWAVLSACDTGLGDLVRAEGVLGLRRSFRIAGAATVISSLWAVEDEATQTWMRELYAARLRDGLDTASAVREASRRVLALRRAAGTSTHPFFWASFSGSGRWE